MPSRFSKNAVAKLMQFQPKRSASTDFYGTWNASKPAFTGRWN